MFRAWCENVLFEQYGAEMGARQHHSLALAGKAPQEVQEPCAHASAWRAGHQQVPILIAS